MMCIKNKHEFSPSPSPTLSLSHVTTLILFLFLPPQIKFLKVEMEKKTKIIKDLQQEVSPPRSTHGLHRTSLGFFPSWCLSVTSRGSFLPDCHLNKGIPKFYTRTRTHARTLGVLGTLGASVVAYRVEKDSRHFKQFF